MQMIQAMTAIANDGKMMKPYVVDKIVNTTDDTVEETVPEIAGQPISKETAKEVREILETVITAPHGTGNRHYHLEGYSLAGKTGTAQIAGPGGKYLSGSNQFLYSFIGLAPADDPQLVMFVAVEQPVLPADESGGMPVSLVFNPVMKNSLQYLNIKPEDIPESKITEIPDLSIMQIGEAEKLLKDGGLSPIIIGKGDKIIGQSPKEGTPMIEGEKIFIKTDGELSIPDMFGWSKRDVLKAAQLAGLKVSIVGDGFAYTQNLKPNSPMQEGDQIAVTFETPMDKIEREKHQLEEADHDPPLN